MARNGSEESADRPECDAAAVVAWFSDHLPAEWQAQGLTVEGDNDELLVVVHLPPAAAGPEGGQGPFGSGDGARIDYFRAQTRDERMTLATAAERLFGRKVSWGAATGDLVATFTTASVPVMTRLRMPERRVLDTLIDGGVARSRSEALAWCVRLVGDNEGEWIGRLRQAFRAVEAVRAEGPASRRGRRS